MNEPNPNAGFNTTHWSMVVWTALPLFQMLFGISPKDPTDQEQQDFDQSTVIGTVIRIAAMIVGFACPILFVTASMGPDIASDRTLRVAAICCIFGCVLLTAAAKGIEDFLYGPRQD